MKIGHNPHTMQLTDALAACAPSPTGLRMALSADGRWVAVRSHGITTVCRADGSPGRWLYGSSARQWKPAVWQEDANAG